MIQNKVEKLVGGPANQGLASIVLEIDADDNIWAVAVLGPDEVSSIL